MTYFIFQYPPFLSTHYQNTRTMTTKKKMKPTSCTSIRAAAATRVSQFSLWGFPLYLSFFRSVARTRVLWIRSALGQGTNGRRESGHVVDRQPMHAGPLSSLFSSSSCYVLNRSCVERRFAPRFAVWRKRPAKQTSRARSNDADNLCRS